MRNKLCFLVCLIALSAANDLYAQKVKYKDVFVLLNAKKFEDAEPHLKRYLAEAKEAENPSAYLFMAKIYDDKAKRGDYLSQTNAIITYTDSAIYYFKFARKYIDEKEIKKNSDYYADYNRRDLRTGKFEIKLSDIQYEIDKSIENLELRKKQTVLLRTTFDRVVNNYKKANELYKSVQAAYEDSKALYLLSNDELLASIKQIALHFDSAQINFAAYKNISKSIGKTGYNHQINIKEITDFKRDGASMTDFLNDELSFWNYAKWANNTVDIVEKEIIPIKKHLIDFDIEINKLSKLLKEDSASVSNDLAKLTDRVLSSQLKKYDPNPLPLAIFSVKITDLQFQSDKLENRKKQNDPAITSRLAYAQLDLKNAERFSELATQLNARDIDKEAANYLDFVENTFSDVNMLKSFVRSTYDYARRELADAQKRVKFLEEGLKWIIVNNDSVPLNEGLNSRYHQPLIIEAEQYTLGFVSRDKKSGYFATIPASRLPEVYLEIDLNELFTVNDTSLSSAIAYADQGGQVYFLVFFTLMPDSESKVIAHAVKIYKVDGVVWNTSLQLNKKPFGINYKSDSGDLSIYYDMHEGQTVAYVLDKSGKAKN
ncbi:MAG TPA: hypothetical protein PKC24_06340 [Cyclobacteriaceae bacterium]|nr:hypothetical protein [Cyclobacteriaceae bacterium]